VVASEVQAISSLAGDISWVMLALVIAVVLCWLVLRSRRPSPVEVAED